MGEPEARGAALPPPDAPPPGGCSAADPEPSAPTSPSRSVLLVGNEEAGAAAGANGAPKPNPAEHLKPHRFEKGKSGNPGGRPKGRSVTAALRELGDSEHNGKRLVDLLAERIFKEALSGKFTFAKELLERLEGKVADKHQIESTGEQRVYVCAPPRLIGDGPVKRAPEPEPEEPGE